MEFIETTIFTKLVAEFLSDEEYADLQIYLHQNPKSGKVVQGSGGVRKVRWAAADKGKSGGVRVIYYYKKAEVEIWLLTIYSKSEIVTISPRILRQIAKEIEND